MTCAARTPRLPGMAVAPPEQPSVRRLTWATLITSCGNGAWCTCWALFLTRSVGLSPAQVGIGITIAGAVGLLASAPLGVLADRFGTAAVLVPLSLLQAAGFVAYLAVALVNAGSFLVYALVVAAPPFVGRHPLPRSTPPARPGPFGDLPYLTLAAIAGVLALCWGMLSSGLPLWVASDTLAPLWISAVIVLFNALTISALQIPITRGVSSPLRAARAARLAGAALALSCVLFALSQGRGGAVAVLVLLSAATVHVAGELLFVAASWRLSVDLMPADAPAQYQGVFATGQATAQMIAPAVMTTLVIGWRAAGWLVLATVFTLAVLPATPATRWALRTRRTRPQPPSTERAIDETRPRLQPRSDRRVGAPREGGRRT